MKVEELILGISEGNIGEGDTIDLQGKVFRLKAPNSNDFDGELVWGQFVVIKDDTGEQGCWLRLDSQEDAVTKGTSISIKGKLGKEYTTSRGKKARSINNCEFEVIGKEEPAQSTSQPTQSSVSSQTDKVDDKVWREKDLRMARESALKNATHFVVAKMVKLNERFKYAQEDVDFIYKDMGITSEDITKEFGGSKIEVIIPEKTKTKKTKETEETEEEDWATDKQVALIEKSVVTSHLLKEPEKEKIENYLKEGLTFTKAGEIISWWLGDMVEDIEGERKTRGRAEKMHEDSTKADKANKEEKIKKARTIVKAHGSVEVKDKTAPFPDEDIPGSSPENAIKLKKKGEIPF